MTFALLLIAYALIALGWLRETWDAYASQFTVPT